MVATLIPDNIADVVAVHLHGVIDQVTPIQHKVSHRMFNAVWHSDDGAQPIVIRFYNGIRCDEEARIEASALRELSRMGYPVPELFCCIDDSKVSGTPFIVMQHLNGRSLGDIALGNPSQIPYWIEQAASLLVRLHNLPWQDGFDMFQPPMETLDYADRQIKWWTREALKVGAADAKPGFDWLRANLYRARECAAKSLIHRDFHPNNLMATDELITGVIDWGEMTIADPAIDIAWSRMILETEVDPKLADSFNEAYRRRNPEAQLTQHFWEVFAACKRLTAMANIRQVMVNGMSAHDGNLPPVHEETREAVRTFMESRLIDDD
ncbi:MAG: phosphotransferase [Anaerolineae bacterium]|nr:phosphotransferase [Anaerolineae bacterium]